MYNEKKIRLYLFGGVFVLVGFFYLITCAPTASFWDCGEFIGCAYILGVPHPPGTPLMVLVGRLFSFLPVSKEIAFRVNLFSVLTGALTCAFVYYITVRLIGIYRKKSALPDLILTHAVGIGAALLLAFSESHWINSIETETYSPAAFFIGLAAYLTFIWYDNIGKRHNKKTLLLIAYLLVLSTGIYLAPIAIAPAILLFVIIADWRSLLDSKFIIAAILLLALAPTTNLYLFIRAHHDPGINECDPRTRQAIYDVLTRKQYGPMNMLPRKTQMETGMSLIPAYIEQVKLYLRYLSWQFVPTQIQTKPFNSFPIGWRFIVILFFAVGILGMWVSYKSDKRTFVLIFFMFLLLSLGFVTYLNMRFSPSDPNPAHQPREVRERDYFFPLSHIFLAVFYGIGFWYILMRLRKYFRQKRELIYTYTSSAVVILISFSLCAVHFHTHDRHDDWIPSDYGENMLNSCDDNSIVFTNGDNDTFPLWFVHEVKKVKPSVTVANLSLLNTNWYIKQLKRRGIPISFTNDEIDKLRPIPVTENGEPLFPFMRFGRLLYVTRNGEVVEHVKKDKKDYCKMKDGSLLEVKTFYVKNFAVRDIIATNAGKEFKVDEYFDLTRFVGLRMPALYFAPPEEFMERVIKGYEGKIPVYFAVTCSRENLGGLDPYLRLEGMVYRLIGYKNDNFNLERTEELLYNVYKFESVFNDKLYKNANTLKLLSNYAAAYFRLGLEYRKQGNLDKAIAMLEEGKRFRPSEILPFAYNLSTLYAEKGDFTKSISYLKDAIEKDPNNIFFYNRLGLIHQHTGDIEKAKYVFRKAIEVVPSHPEAYANLHFLYSSIKDTTSALKIIQEWFLQNPKNSGIYAALASLYQMRGKTSIAEKYLLKSLEVDPKNPRNYGILFNFYKKAGRIKDAKAILGKWLEIQPEDKTASDLLKSL